jgi:hypothetical protein
LGETARILKPHYHTHYHYKRCNCTHKHTHCTHTAYASHRPYATGAPHTLRLNAPLSAYGRPQAAQQAQPRAAGHHTHAARTRVMLLNGKALTCRRACLSDYCQQIQ